MITNNNKLIILIKIKIMITIIITKIIMITIRIISTFARTMLLKRNIRRTWRPS